MPRQRNISRVGISVRIPIDDMRDYKLIANGLRSRMAVSRLLLTLVMEIVQTVLRPDEKKEKKAKIPTFRSGGIITEINRDPSLVAICERLKKRATENMSGRKDQAVWLGFSQDERESLAKIWQELHWSEAKLILECLQDAVVLGSLMDAPIQAPVVPTLYWGAHLFKREAEKLFLGQIEEVLGKARHERNVSGTDSGPTPQGPTEIGFDPV